MWVAFGVKVQVQSRKWPRLTNHKQEVTRNTETFVSGTQFVDFCATWGKQIISVIRAPCQQRLLALIHTALYCTNWEYCVCLWGRPFMKSLDYKIKQIQLLDDVWCLFNVWVWPLSYTILHWTLNISTFLTKYFKIFLNKTQTQTFLSSVGSKKIILL